MSAAFRAGSWLQLGVTCQARSEVRGPTAAPDGPFPFLAKIVSRNTSNPRHIDRGEYVESLFCQETIGVVISDTELFGCILSCSINQNASSETASDPCFCHYI